VVLGVDVVPHRLAGHRLHGDAALAQLGGELVGLLVDAGEEGLVRHALVGQQRLEAQDRVAELPLLDLGRDAVLRRVVGGRVRTHAVGVGLDEQGAVAVAGLVQAVLRHGIRGEDVVAVDAHAGEAEAAGALEERDAGLLLDGLGDGPLVVLAEEDHGGVEARRVDERLVDIAL
jgi:hypothetical protein